MRTRRSFRLAAVIITALGCVLVAVGVGGVPDRAPVPASQTGAEVRVPASAAAWVYADEPAPPTGPAAALRAGDTDGGAVTYLRFEVPPTGPPPERALLQLTSAGPPLPSLVELVTVPDTRWEPETLSWADAPLLGPVVQSAQPAADDQRVVFDVTALLRGGAGRPASAAFAVTVPPDRGHAAFAAAGDDAPVLRLFQVSPAPSPAPSSSSSPSPPPVRSPGLVSALPVVPEDATAPRVPPVRSGPPVLPSPPEPPEPPATPPPSATPPPAGSPPPECVVGELLVPSCGVLWGVAPDGHTGSPRAGALADFERATGRHQDIYHAYHRAQELFPTQEEAAIAAEGRILFLNWKPLNWSWAQIAAGHPAVDSYLDRLAEHINTTFPDPFFFTIHHEPENDVRPSPGSGWQPADYAAMYRHVVQRLRGAGVANLVSVMNHMAYVPWNAKPWFPDLYPGADVVDWVAWNSYAYSDPGYGYGDFGEMMNRRSSQYPDWPGFYTWATDKFPDKPFMLGEWGVWYSRGNPDHMAQFYDSVARQTPLFPRVKAMVYFDTPSDQRARDSRPTLTEAGLAAYRRLGALPYFQVRLRP